MLDTRLSYDMISMRTGTHSDGEKIFRFMALAVLIAIPLITIVEQLLQTQPPFCGRFRQIGLFIIAPSLGHAACLTTDGRVVAHWLPRREQ